MASDSSSNSDKAGVHLTILNDIQPEHFEYMETLPYTPTNPLIRYLEQAADKNSHFKFSATYFPGMGYFIDSINGLAGKWDPDQSFWKIENSDFEAIDKGVSSYIPDDGERLIFKFTKRQPLRDDNFFSKLMYRLQELGTGLF